MANFYGEFDTDKYIKETFFNSENYEHNPLYVPFMEDRGYVLHKKIEYNYIFRLK